ncbi:hypothetical protein LMH87_010935 [Akanthomyces muscarius]|uniref:Uncharacterized protein n=1 Tax=Akanthomyces muscarius TaxID=2231603 RepID=A0A9W8UJH1_AKAMU|nr:hypothetical protein LMH87_010935 [Akanthomyces muscarius]KAJ4150172.1 hypothetical protein LMH87_010935 [Akanthomyces muscarius]
MLQIIFTTTSSSSPTFHCYSYPLISICNPRRSSVPDTPAMRGCSYVSGLETPYSAPNKLQQAANWQTGSLAGINPAPLVPSVTPPVMPAPICTGAR